eukprot:UN25440
METSISTETHCVPPIIKIMRFEKSFQNRTGNVLAMISNCSSKKRNRWIEGLMEAGLNIDHYGECWHNHDEFSYYDEELDWG